VRTPITDLLGVEFPLIQGGLWGMAFAELCGPVSQAGAFGQITAGLHETPESLAREIEKVRALTTKPFGVNFPLKSRDLTRHLELAIEAGCGGVTVTAGDPAPFLRLVAGRTPTLALVSTVHQAQRAEAASALASPDGGGLAALNKTPIGKAFTARPGGIAEPKRPKGCRRRRPAIRSPSPRRPTSIAAPTVGSSPASPSTSTGNASPSSSADPSWAPTPATPRSWPAWPTGTTSIASSPSGAGPGARRARG